MNMSESMQPFIVLEITSSRQLTKESAVYMEFSGKEHFEPYEPLRIPTNSTNKPTETTSEVVGPESVNKTEKTATNHPDDPL